MRGSRYPNIVAQFTQIKNMPRRTKLGSSSGRIILDEMSGATALRRGTFQELDRMEGDDRLDGGEGLDKGVRLDGYYRLDGDGRLNGDTRIT